VTKLKAKKRLRKLKKDSGKKIFEVLGNYDSNENKNFNSLKDEFSSNMSEKSMDSLNSELNSK